MADKINADQDGKSLAQKTRDNLDKTFASLPKDLPKEPKKLIQLLRAEIKQSRFSSPIPPPEFMSGWEQLLPGSADRILTMAERGQQADIAARAKLINGQNQFHKYNFILDIFWGVTFLIIFLLLLSVGLWLISHEHTAEAFKLWGGSSFIALIFGGAIAYFRRDKGTKKSNKRD